MRASILFASGLLAMNIVAIELETTELPDPEGNARDIVVSEIVVAPSVETSGPRFEDARRLAWLRAARRAGFRVTDCPHRDPLATLDADVDPSPGLEHVIGNRHDGVAMYAQSGELLAYGEPIGCAQAFDGDQSLTISFESSTLVLYTRTMAHSGEHLRARIIARKGDTLDTVLDDIDVGGVRSGFGWDWDAEGKLYISGDSAEVRMHGRHRSGDGTWEAVDEHCTYNLVTRSSSCRTRGAGQTSESE